MPTAGFEDRLRSFVGFSTEGISCTGVSFLMDLRTKKCQYETRLCSAELTVLSALSLLECERLLRLLSLVSWKNKVSLTSASSLVPWVVVFSNMGTRQSPIMSDKISRKMKAEAIEASRGKRAARPLQVQNKAY